MIDELHLFHPGKGSLAGAQLSAGVEAVLPSTGRASQQPRTLA